VVALVALAGLGACHRPYIKKGSPPNSLAGRPVRHVTIAGNRVVSDDELVSGLAHRPATGVWGAFATYTHYDPFALKVDADRIEMYYAARGYFAARVTASSVRPVAGVSVDVKFVVVEGAPATIATLDVRGVPPALQARAESLRAGAGLRVGARLVHQDYLDYKRALQAALAARGYAYAKVEGTIEVAPGDARAGVVVRVDAGPVVAFGDTEIDGNGRIPQQLLTLLPSSAEVVGANVSQQREKPIPADAQPALRVTQFVEDPRQRRVLLDLGPKGTLLQDFFHISRRDSAE
jgi:hypothetical protein